MKKAFTLIELLVIIAIIGLILALLFPALGAVREEARRAQCMNNLRQIGMAMTMYLDEHEFRFPTMLLSTGAAGGWYRNLEPYIDDRELFKCPSYKPHQYIDWNHFSYGYNTLGLTEDLWAIDGGKDINEVVSPSHCIMVADSWVNVFTDMTVIFVIKPIISENRHVNGPNILFVDGHVKWYSYSDIQALGDESTLWWNY